MSSNFDWSQFEEVKPETFDWSQFEEVTSEKQPISLPKLGFKKKVAEESKIPEMKRTLGRTGKVVGSTVIGLPGDIVSQIGTGLNFLAKNVPGGKPKSEEELKQITENPLTSKKISEGIEKFFPSTQARTPEEKEWEENLSLITSLVTPLPTGKTKAIDPRTASKLYKAGKSLGLSAKELTPLIQGEVKTSVLGKFAKKTKALKKTLDMTEGKLSDIYTGIKESASKFPKIPGKDTSNLIDKFQDIKFGLQKTLQPSPDKKAAIGFIDAAIEKANNFGTSPEELINFYQDINNAVNWNAIKGGRKVLSNLKSPIIETLESTNPKIAKDFVGANALWSKLKGFEKQIGIPKIEKYIDYGEAPALLASLAFGNYGKAATTASAIAFRRVATKLLSDPKWQNIHARILSSIKNQTPAQATKLLQILKNRIKTEMPKEYEGIDWSEFEKAD